MFISKKSIVSSVLAFSAVSMLAMGAASADRVKVIVPPPVFLPQAEFRFDNGYYRTNEGHYYHYDADRSGWHYGRNHEEGVRYEHRHH